jgi:hypothetical protein
MDRTTFAKWVADNFDANAAKLDGQKRPSRRDALQAATLREAARFVRSCEKQAADACKGSNATISTIARLAAALDSSVADLLDDGSAHRPAKTVEL